MQGWVHPCRNIAGRMKAIAKNLPQRTLVMHYLMPLPGLKMPLTTWMVGTLQRLLRGNHAAWCARRKNACRDAKTYANGCRGMHCFKVWRFTEDGNCPTSDHSKDPEHQEDGQWNREIFCSVFNPILWKANDFSQDSGPISYTGQEQQSTLCPR